MVNINAAILKIGNAITKETIRSWLKMPRLLKIWSNMVTLPITSKKKIFILTNMQKVTVTNLLLSITLAKRNWEKDAFFMSTYISKEYSITLSGKEYRKVRCTPILISVTLFSIADKRRGIYETSINIKTRKLQAVHKNTFMALKYFL